MCIENWRVLMREGRDQVMMKSSWERKKEASSVLAVMSRAEI